MLALLTRNGDDVGQLAADVKNLELRAPKREADSPGGRVCSTMFAHPWLYHINPLVVADSAA